MNNNTDKLINCAVYLDQLGLNIELTTFDFTEAMEGWTDVRSLAPRTRQLRLATLGWGVSVARSLLPGMVFQCDDDHAIRVLSAELANLGLVLEDPYTPTAGRVVELIVLTKEQQRELDRSTADMLGERGLRSSGFGDCNR